jgi:succinate dehydrogenase/fumarate reductase iron-sulfur protein
MKARVRILRWDPKTAGKPRYRTYTVTVSSGDKVLGALRSIHRHLDSCLSFRFNCRARHCGECSMMINGTPGLSCAVPMSRELTLEPLRNLPVIKDLVIDRGEVYRSIMGLLPPIEVRTHDGIGLRPVDMEVVGRIMLLDSCIHCLCCMAVCPAYKKEPGLFLGPMGLLALATTAEQGARIDAVKKAAACTECGLCERVCPRRIPILRVAVTHLRKAGGRGIARGK